MLLVPKLSNIWPGSFILGKKSNDFGKKLESMSLKLKISDTFIDR